MFISFAMSMIIANFHLDLATGGLISSITNLGMLAGGVVFGILADKFGRVRTFTYSILFFAIGTALTVMATNIEQIYIYRFIAGIGAGGEYGIGMALVAEVWPKKKQGRASAYVSSWQKSQGLSVSSSALWTISTAVGMLVGMLTFGQFTDRLGIKRTYGIFLLASASAVFLYSQVSGSAALLIGGAVVGFFSNGMFAGYGALISSFYPVQVRSTATNTIFNFGRALGGLSPILVGYILQIYDMTVAMAYLAVLYCISFVVMLSLKKTKKVESVVLKRAS